MGFSCATQVTTPPSAKRASFEKQAILPRIDRLQKKAKRLNTEVTEEVHGEPGDSDTNRKLVIMVVTFGFVSLGSAEQGLDFVVLGVGEDADHGHHAHHAGAPVGWEAVGLGFAHTFGVVHGHFHERVLWEAGNGVGVFGDGGMMHVLDADAVGEGLHLAEGARVSGVGGLDLTIT